MQNWWIAALESAGIWTREQAEHVSNEIRSQIHSDRYVDTLETLKSVLEKGKFASTPLVSKLEADVQALQANPQVATLMKTIEGLAKDVEDLKKKTSVKSPETKNVVANLE